MPCKAIGLLVLLAACAPRMTTVGELPDAGPPATLTVTGRVCSARVDPANFPVKVVLLIDQSAASCVVDPPGAQSPGTFCDGVTPTLPGPLPTVPARLRATNRLLDALSVPGSGALVALVPFETNVRGVYPPSGFVQPGEPTLRARVNQLQVELGEQRDLEGALAEAHRRIVADIDEVARSTPFVLPHTRYVVLLVTAGPPRPRCAVEDNLTTYADDLRPGAGKWPDTHSELCNQTPAITGFVAGTDRNQQAQLFAFVDRLKAEQRLKRVADVRLHTVLMTNAPTWAACGPACESLPLFGLPTVRWPGPTPVASQPDALAAEARYLLKELTARGDGTFAEFASADGLASMRFEPARFESLASPNVLRELIAEPRSAVASNGRWVLDEDGDGVPNEEEATLGTDARSADTDGDGFTDRFEVDRAAQGFDARVKDARGCDPLSALTPNCLPRDVDGDGVSNFAEAFLGTGETFADSDLDGFPDGLELKYGLDPATALDPQADTDGDGVTDADELRRGSHPRQADAALPLITSTWTRAPQQDSSQCYDFTIGGLPMVEGWTGPKGSGVSLFKLWFGEVPEKAQRSYGVWKAACAAARRDLSGATPVLEPPGLTMSLGDTLFSPPRQLVGASGTTTCLGADLLPR